MQLQSTLLFGSLGFSESGSPTPKKHGEKSFTRQKTNTQQFFFHDFGKDEARGKTVGGFGV